MTVGDDTQQDGKSVENTADQKTGDQKTGALNGDTQSNSAEGVSKDPLDSVIEERKLRDADFSAFDDDGEVAGDATGGDSSKEALREMEQKYLRSLADFENFKKRSLKERSELLKYQGEKVFVDLLGVVDNFDRALENAQAKPEQLREGVELIHRMFDQVLVKWDVKGETAVGTCLLYTSPSPRDATLSRMPSSA